MPIKMNLPADIKDRWYVDKQLSGTQIYVWDYEQIAQLYLDGLYIGIIEGKENIKFLEDHLKCQK